MKFSAVAVAALVAGASAHYNETVYTTEVVTAYTTYCPSATTITHGTKTYTVTEVRWLSGRRRISLGPWAGMVWNDRQKPSQQLALHSALFRPQLHLIFAPTFRP